MALLDLIPNSLLSIFAASEQSTINTIALCKQTLAASSHQLVGGTSKKHSQSEIQSLSFNLQQVINSVCILQKNISGDNKSFIIPMTVKGVEGFNEHIDIHIVKGRVDCKVRNNTSGEVL